jgi:pyruvate/2-oxoglutarate dehydrogenase complex dihydrolipoamide dehydrogenase (E3) component
MAAPEQVDALIIGSGQAGSPLAETLAGAGWTVVLVEREHVGGTCINVGCTPTKTMVASGRVAYLARRAADYGVQTGDVSVDMQRVRQRKRQMVHEWRDGKQQRLEQTEHLSLVFGEARFTAPKTVEVALNAGGTRQFTAKHILINAGARSASLSLPGLEGVAEERVLDSTSIMELGEVPPHLIVLGGGYIGLEFGQLFRRFGSAVTIVQHGPQLLGREDKDVAEGVLNILREDGIEVLLETEAASVAASGSGVELAVRDKDGQRTIEGSHLLIATGRVPNSDGLNLGGAGIETDAQGFIKVNDHLETSVTGVYALGDIKGGPAFTHVSYHDSTIVAANLLDGKNGTARRGATTKGRLVPYTVFIDPQLGRVGMTEAEARTAGKTIKVAKLGMDSVARAIEVGETRGLMKVVIDATNDQILGCAILGLEGGEIMSMIQIAMMGKLPYTVLRDAVLAHPTLAEALNTLFYTVE